MPPDWAYFEIRDHYDGEGADNAKALVKVRKDVERALLRVPAMVKIPQQGKFLFVGSERLADAIKAIRRAAVARISSNPEVRLSQANVDDLLSKLAEEADKEAGDPPDNSPLKVGDEVLIIEGAYSNILARVREINPDCTHLAVYVEKQALRSAKEHKRHLTLPFAAVRRRTPKGDDDRKLDEVQGKVRMFDAMTQPTTKGLRDRDARTKKALAALKASNAKKAAPTRKASKSSPAKTRSRKLT